MSGEKGGRGFRDDFCDFLLEGHVPNAETIKALEAAEAGEGLIEYNSIEDFFKSLSALQTDKEHEPLDSRG